MRFVHEYAQGGREVDDELRVMAVREREHKPLDGDELLREVGAQAGRYHSRTR